MYNKTFHLVHTDLFDQLDLSNSTVELVDLSISLPPQVFNISTDTAVAGLIFTSYRDTTLFQLTPPVSANTSDYNYTADSVVLGFAVADTDVRNLTDPVNITLQSQRALQGLVSQLLSQYIVMSSLLQNWSEPICVSWVFNSIGGEIIILAFHLRVNVDLSFF